jgi:MFS family permease
MSVSSTRVVDRIHYAWVVAGVTFLVLLVSAGVRATPAVLIVPLEEEFGWSRATTSFAVSLDLLLFGLVGPFAAVLMERVGVRRTMLLALSLLGLGVAATLLMREAWQLVLLWGVMVGAGTGLAALVLGAVVANRWFTERRGVVMGVLTASSAAGQLVFLPGLAWLAAHQGWRAVAGAVAAAVVATVPTVWLLMRDHPAEVGALPYGGVEAPEPTGAPVGSAFQALREGMRSRDFWLLGATFFVCGASTVGLIGTHFIPAAHDHGIPGVRAAGLLAVMGVLDLLGTTVSGWLSDRWDSRKLLAWYYGLRGLSLLFLPYAFMGPAGSLALFALFYGLDWVATVPPTMRLTADAFGKARVGVMFGWIVAGHQLGAAAASFGAGVLRTVTGDYQAAFLGSGALCLLAMGLALALRSRPGTAALSAPASAVSGA